MNESGEPANNDNAGRSTRTEIRQPICAIARGALSLREPLKHIVKKRVRSGRDHVFRRAARVAWRTKSRKARTLAGGD